MHLSGSKDLVLVFISTVVICGLGVLRAKNLMVGACRRSIYPVLEWKTYKYAYEEGY